MAEPAPPTSDPFAALPDEIMTSILGLLERWQDMASLSSTSKPNQRLIFTTVDVMLLALLEKLPQNHDPITVSSHNWSPNQMGLAGYFTFKIENGNILIPDEPTQSRLQTELQYLDFYEQPPDDYINIGKNTRALHKYLLAKVPVLRAQELTAVYPTDHFLKHDIKRLLKLIRFERGLTSGASFNYVTDLQGGAIKSYVKYDNKTYKIRRDDTGKYILKDRHKLYLKSIKGKFKFIR